MTLTPVARIAVALSSLLLPCPSPAQTPDPPQPAPRVAPATLQKFGHLPLSFERNTGQAAGNVQWLARGPESTLFLSGNDATIQLNHIEKVQRDGVELPRARNASLRMSLLHSQPAQASVGEKLQTGKANYFTGNDSTRWHRDVPLYGEVRLQEVYPGISLLYHGERGELEYDFIVAPHSDASRIALGFTGAAPSLADNGDLLLPIPGEHPVRFDKPVVYQIKNGVRTPVESKYRIAEDGQVTFSLGKYDPEHELVIDPKLIFLGTLAAGNFPYSANLGQMTVDSTGAMYFIGTTNDPSYPTVAGAYQRVCGPATGGDGGACGASSAYVTKLSADGATLVYSTYLSGEGSEQGTSIAVDSFGVAYLLGATASSNFPTTTDAFQRTSQLAPSPGSRDGRQLFFAKLSADGSTLLYASFLGGSAPSWPVATALDSAGNWYLYGQTSASLASDPYPARRTSSVPFPGVGSSGFQHASSAGTNNRAAFPQDIAAAAVLSKFSNDGHTLLYGTYFADEANGYPFYPTSLATGANGLVFIGGYSKASALVTTPGAVKRTCTAYNSPNSTCTTVDGFVVAFDTTRSGSDSLVYSTRIGGSAVAQESDKPNQEVLGIAADAANDIYVTGYTFDQTFPVPSSGYLNACNTFDPGNSNNCSSAFVLELNPTGTDILAGSFLAGSPAYYESSSGATVVLDSSNQVYLYGTSQDLYNTFPLVNPVQGWQGNSEPFLATMSSDLTRLLFSTRIGNPSLLGGNESAANAFALDASGDIYFAGTTHDPNFAATPGAYATAVDSGTEAHTFFGKISPVLPAGATLPAITPTAQRLP